MKKCIRKSVHLATAIAALGSLSMIRVNGQTYTSIYSFTAIAVDPSRTDPRGYILSTNSDGQQVLSRLVLSGNTLYGTAARGGSNGNGTIFKLNTDGSGFTTLHSFTLDINNPNSRGTNSDGANPWAGLALSGNTLYGTCSAGGSSGGGTVFAINTDGTGFSTLHSFAPYSSDNIEGFGPNGSLVLSGNTLYGTASSGGTDNNGTVFRLNTDGTGFAVVHTFPPNSFNSTNGASPLGGLVLSSNTLYGTSEGFDIVNGTVFAVNIDGTDFRTLHTFSPLSEIPNSDGNLPYAGLVLLSTTLYGTASSGGTGNNGTVFKVNTDGSGFTTLHDFTRLIPRRTASTNSDGANPYSDLILSGNTLYGTAGFGGSSGNGTVFAVNTDGTGFVTLHSFTDSDGRWLTAGMVLSGTTLYGTTQYGGTSDAGTIFSISFPSPPQLTIIPVGANAILSWPTNADGFTLQSSANLGLSAIWSTNLPAPIVVNGQNTVTIPISGTQQFFRLSQ